MWLERRSRKAPRFLGVWLFCSVLLTAPGDVVAQDDVLITDTYPTREEFAELPRFCFVQRMHSRVASIVQELGGLTPELVNEGKKWRDMLGPGVWAALHHYCAGLARMGRYRKSVQLGIGQPGELTPRQRLTLERALGEFQFMKYHMERDRSVLYPEWALNQAIAHRELGEIDKAKERLLAAIVFKDDYDVPYLQLASLLEQEMNRTEAISILEIGLSRTGGSAAIRKELANMKGE